MEDWRFWLFVAMALAFYFLPAIIAAARGHRNSGAIAVLNLFLGWTLVGWIVALVWSFTNGERAVDVRVNVDGSKPADLGSYKACVFCAETIKSSAIKCRFCGSELPQPSLGKEHGKATIEDADLNASKVAPVPEGALVQQPRWTRLSPAERRFRYCAWAVVSAALLFGIWRQWGDQLVQVASSYLPSDVYPKQLAGHKAFELAQLIKTLVPADDPRHRGPPGQTVVDWGHAEDSGVLWLTPGTAYEKMGEAEEETYHRVGIARVHVGATSAHVLREHTQELGWTVDMVGDSNANHGPEVIEIRPGVPGEVCFGSTTDGCTFKAPVGALKAAGFSVKPICQGEGMSERVQAFRLSRAGSAPTVLLWKESGGSGGIASWLEIALDTRGTVKTFCGNEGVTRF